ncbi:unnamed protein product, partial [Timema podura]|nr:unnamed protein product [Timema podura]
MVGDYNHASRRKNGTTRFGIEMLKMKIFLILATLLVAAQAISFFDLVMEEWTTYKVQYVLFVQ